MADFVPPTPEETADVAKLKEELLKSHVTFPFTDVTILRFLRGRKNVFDKALHGLQRHVQWREENHVDLLKDDTSSFRVEIDKQIISCHEGIDRKGRPLLVVYVRRHKKDSRDIEHVKANILYSIETALKRTRPHEEKYTIIFDMSGFTLSCMDYDAVRFLVQTLQLNYPETLSVGILVNSPMLFTACWAIIRPWLDPVTANKVVFIKPFQLSDYVDPSELPPDVGSTSLSSAALASTTGSSEVLTNDSLAAAMPPDESSSATAAATSATRGESRAGAGAGVQDRGKGAKPAAGSGGSAGVATSTAGIPP